MPIPKIIHYCWFGRNPKPKLAKKCIKSWKKYCKGYEIKEWNEDNFDISKAPLYVRQAYEAKKWGFVPDYIRLWIIYNYGGIYLDTDVEIIKPLDDLLENKAFAGFETPSNVVALGLGFAAEPGNRIIKELMDSYNDLSFINQDGTLNMIPAPTLNSEVFRKIGLKENNTNQMLEDMTIYSSEYFCPIDTFSMKLNKTKSTYTIHHFMGSWVSDEDKVKEKESRKKRRKDERKWKRRDSLHSFIHFPNRAAKKIFGDSFYSKLKAIVKK